MGRHRANLGPVTQEEYKSVQSLYFQLTFDIIMNRLADLKKKFHKKLDPGFEKELTYMNFVYFKT